MATFKNGAFGAFRGRAGNLVGSKWKNLRVLRIRPESVSNPRTPGQMNVRSRFALMGHFLSTQRDLVRIGWKSGAENQTPFNAAMRYNMRHATIGEHPDVSIDYPNVMLSMGQLPVASNVQVSVSSAMSLSLSWTNNSGQTNAADSDLLMIGAYHDETGSGYVIPGAFQRSDQSGEINLPDNWSGRSVEIYLFMVSTLASGIKYSREMVSDTLYLGNFNLEG